MIRPIDFYQTTDKTAGFIQHMQKRFPKYCKATNSMANNGEMYGICLSPKAVRYLEGKKEQKRSKPNQMTARLGDADKTAFDRARLKRGHTVQAAIEEAIMLYIKESENT